jgi:UDP-N-acetylmuramyl pentapeptide synthase
LDIAPAVIARGLVNTALPGKRMNSITVNNCVWVNDAYNANPQSMKSSLACIKENLEEDKPLLLVLGDMLELGDEEIAYHREVLDFVQKNFSRRNNCRIFLLGKRFAEAYKTAGITLQTECFDLLEALQSKLSATAEEGMTIFLKSSNSIGLSKVEPC